MNEGIEWINMTVTEEKLRVRGVCKKLFSVALRKAQVSSLNPADSLNILFPFLLCVL